MLQVRCYYNRSCLILYREFLRNLQKQTKLANYFGTTNKSSASISELYDEKTSKIVQRHVLCAYSQIRKQLLPTMFTLEKNIHSNMSYQKKILSRIIKIFVQKISTQKKYKTSNENIQENS